MSDESEGLGYHGPKHEVVYVRWHSMDTAPKDGTTVVVRVGTYVYVARWIPSQFRGPEWKAFNAGIVEPDAWFPIPQIEGTK